MDPSHSKLYGMVAVNYNVNHLPDHLMADSYTLLERYPRFWPLLASPLHLTDSGVEGMFLPRDELDLVAADREGTTRRIGTCHHTLRSHREGFWIKVAQMQKGSPRRGEKEKCGCYRGHQYFRACYVEVSLHCTPSLPHISDTVTVPC